MLNLTLNITIEGNVDSAQVNWDKTNQRLMNGTEASIYKPQCDAHTSSGQAGGICFLCAVNVIGTPPRFVQICSIRKESTSHIPCSLYLLVDG